MKTLRDLNLNSLRIVESAARTGSFVRAAEEQLLTPSAVSQRVKKLESQLQFRIFNRRSNAVILTTEGSAFVAQVRDALDTILTAGLEARSYGRDQILKISALPTFLMRWLLKRLPDFEATNSRFSLNLSNSYAPVNFGREDFDLAIRYGNGDFPGLSSQLLFQEALTPVCSPDLLKRKNVNAIDLIPADLGRFTLLHSDTCTMNWQYWLEQTRAHNALETAHSAYFDSCMLSYEAAASGLGFAIANKLYMMDDVTEGCLVAPFDDTLHSGCGWYLVYPTSHGQLERVQLFCEWILEQAQSAETSCAKIYSRSLH